MKGMVIYMKIKLRVAVSLLLFVVIAAIVGIVDKEEDVYQVAAATHFGTDATIPNFPEIGNKGTDNNPFVILEIVPYEGYAEIGYMIGGCEPVPLESLAFNNSVGGTVASTGGLTFEWKAEYTDVLKEGDKVGSGPGEWEYIYGSGNYRRYRNYFTSSNSFLKYALEIPEEQLATYHIQVVTVTPDKLNNTANHCLIDRADLIYLSPKSHYGTSLITIWEMYHPDKKIENEPQNFYSNDLNWETTVKILEKASVSADPAPIIFDVTIFSTDQSYNNNIEPLKYYSTGLQVSSLSASEYNSNIAKLYLIMQEMEPSKFYNEFIKTGKVMPIKLKDSAGNPIIRDGIPMTTGYYLDLAENPSIEYYRKGNVDDAAVWNIHTMLPYRLFENYTALNGNKAFETIGYRIFTYDGDQTHRSIRHNVYAYNGDNSITQILLLNNINENYYNKEAFDYYQNKQIKNILKKSRLLQRSMKLIFCLLLPM